MHTYTMFTLRPLHIHEARVGHHAFAGEATSNGPKCVALCAYTARADAIVFRYGEVAGADRLGVYLGTLSRTIG